MVSAVTSAETKRIQPPDRIISCHKIWPILNSGRLQGAFDVHTHIEAEIQAIDERPQCVEGRCPQSRRVGLDIELAIARNFSAGIQPADSHAGLERLKQPGSLIKPTDDSAFLEGLVEKR